VGAETTLDDPRLRNFAKDIPMPNFIVQPQCLLDKSPRQADTRPALEACFRQPRPRHIASMARPEHRPARYRLAAKPDSRLIRSASLAPIPVSASSIAFRVFAYRSAASSAVSARASRLAPARIAKTAARPARSHASARLTGAGIREAQIIPAAPCRLKIHVAEERLPRPSGLLDRRPTSASQSCRQRSRRPCSWR